MQRTPTTVTVNPSTRATLLERVACGDGNGWEEFYKRYAGLIDWFCRERAVPRMDDIDLRRQVIQSVMIFFSKKQFKYDPDKGRFRNYLLAVTSHKVREVIREARPLCDEAPSRADDDGIDISEIERVPDVSDVFGKWVEADILSHVIKRLGEDPDVNPLHLRVLGLLLDGMQPPAICKNLDIDVNNVYVIKHRLVGRLRELYQQEEGR